MFRINWIFPLYILENTMIDFMLQEIQFQFIPLKGLGEKYLQFFPMSLRYHYFINRFMQGYKLTHITFKPHMVGNNKIPHRTVHRINKETPHSTAASMARPQVLPHEIRAQLPIGYMAHPQ